MKCEHCGHDCSDNALFCSQCGSKLPEKAEAGATAFGDPPSPAQPVPPPLPKPPVTRTAAAKPASHIDRSRSLPIYFWIVLGAGVLSLMLMLYTIASYFLYDFDFYYDFYYNDWSYEIYEDAFELIHASDYANYCAGLTTMLLLTFFFVFAPCAAFITVFLIRRKKVRT